MCDPLHSVVLECGLKEEDVLFYGRNKAKVHLNALNRLRDHPEGKLIVVTAITPIPAGEGKTVTTLGLGDGLRHIGAKAVACMRQPSLGPTLGIKGGAAGGGKAQASPADELNLHFTGDFHAITTAHNLLAALVEAHIFHGNEAGFEAQAIVGMLG